MKVERYCSREKVYQKNNKPNLYQKKQTAQPHFKGYQHANAVTRKGKDRVGEFRKQTVRLPNKARNVMKKLMMISILTTTFLIGSMSDSQAKPWWQYLKISVDLTFGRGSGCNNKGLCDIDISVGGSKIIVAVNEETGDLYLVIPESEIIENQPEKLKDFNQKFYQFSQNGVDIIPSEITRVLKVNDGNQIILESRDYPITKENSIFFINLGHY